MQTQVNPALQALMQTAQMVTPEKSPTVAAKVAQAAIQKIQPQSSPPGIQALLPGAGVQAAQAAQAAQPATQGDLNQIRQMMAQSAPAQINAGVGRLGDVEMAEGGIVGYAGPDGSSVELDESKLSVGERTKRALRRLYERIETGYMQRAGATPEQIAKKLGTEAPVTPQEAPVASYDHEGRIGIASKPVPVAAPVSPAPADRKKPAPAPAPAPSAPIETMLDTRNIPMPPSESSVASAEAERIARESAEEQRKPRVKTQEEIAADAEQRRLTQTGLASLEAQRQRFEEAEAARKAGLSNQQRENLISFLTRVGGAGSLFQGLGQASRGMEPIIAAQRAAEQAANEKKLQYFDLLDQRKDAVERLNLAWLQKDAEKAMAESARIRGIDADLAKTLTTLKADEAKQRLVGEQAMARTQAEIAGRAQEGALNRAQQAEIEGKRLQQQAEQNKQYKLATAIATNQSRLTSAYKEVENILTKKYANQITMFNMMSAEQLQKNPQLAESYNRYLVEKADLEMRMVKPIEAERNRLAAQIEGGGVSRYDAQGNRIR